MRRRKRRPRFRTSEPTLPIRKTSHPPPRLLFLFVGLGFLRRVPFQLRRSSDERPPRSAVPHFGDRICRKGSSDVYRRLVHVLTRGVNRITLEISNSKHTLLRFLNRSSTTPRHSSDGIAGVLEVPLTDGPGVAFVGASGIAYGLSTLVI